MSPRPDLLGCPNEPACPHFWHDIEDWDDQRPTCCEESCLCGKDGR
jgi:hypothetical protein